MSRCSCNYCDTHYDKFRNGRDGRDGKNGRDGLNGRDGRDGISPPGGSSVLEFASFFSTIDSPISVPVGIYVTFSSNGPSFGGAVNKVATEGFEIVLGGTYSIEYNFPIISGNSLGLELNGSLVNNSLIAVNLVGGRVQIGGSIMMNLNSDDLLRVAVVGNAVTFGMGNVWIKFSKLT